MHRVVTITILAVALVILHINAFASPPDRWEHGVLSIWQLGNSAKLVSWNGPAGSHIQAKWDSKEAIDTFLASLSKGQSVEWQAGTEGLAVAALNILGTEGWQLVGYSLEKQASTAGTELRWTWYVKRIVNP